MLILWASIQSLFTDNKFTFLIPLISSSHFYDFLIINVTFFNLIIFFSLTSSSIESSSGWYRKVILWISSTIHEAIKMSVMPSFSFLFFHRHRCCWFDMYSEFLSLIFTKCIRWKYWSWKTHTQKWNHRFIALMKAQQAIATEIIFNQRKMGKVNFLKFFFLFYLLLLYDAHEEVFWVYYQQTVKVSYSAAVLFQFHSIQFIGWWNDW